MDRPALSPDYVRETLRVQWGIEIDDAEATRLLPWIETQREQLAALERFDLGEVRSALAFDPTSPYRMALGDG